MKSKNRMVYGVGVNDADYVVAINEVVGYRENGKPVKKMLWMCPFYSKWANMLRRCYDDGYQKRQPTYLGCSVTPEWHYFMTFRAWMIEQDWETKQLDKDILFPNNKLYSPDTCVFVDAKVNLFLTESNKIRGEWPIGVDYYKRYGKFRAQCNDLITGNKRYLGYFNTAEEAHKAWLAFKLEQAYALALQQSDPRVAAALIDRYENYGANQ